MTVSGYSLPEPDRAITPELKEFAVASMTRARANGNDSKATLNKLALLAINHTYKLPGGLAIPTDLRVWRLKVAARLKGNLPAFFPGVNPLEYDELGNDRKSSPLDGIRTFAQAFGDEAVDTLAPNMEGLKFLSRNMWWIAPTAVGVYFAPQLIKTVKALK